MPSVAANPACRPCPKLRTARYAMLGPGVTSITRVAGGQGHRSFQLFRWNSGPAPKQAVT